MIVVLSDLLFDKGQDSCPMGTTADGQSETREALRQHRPLRSVFGCTGPTLLNHKWMLLFF